MVEEGLALLQSPSLHSSLNNIPRAYWYTGFPVSSFRYSPFRPPRAITSVFDTVLNADFTSMNRIMHAFPSQLVQTIVPTPLQASQRTSRAFPQRAQLSLYMSHRITESTDAFP